MNACSIDAHHPTDYHHNDTGLNIVFIFDSGSMTFLIQISDQFCVHSDFSNTVEPPAVEPPPL
jgi:hypothetical protein